MFWYAVVDSSVGCILSFHGSPHCLSRNVIRYIITFIVIATVYGHVHCLYSWCTRYVSDAMLDDFDKGFDHLIANQMLSNMAKMSCSLNPSRLVAHLQYGLESACVLYLLNRKPNRVIYNMLKLTCFLTGDKRDVLCEGKDMGTKYVSTVFNPTYPSSALLESTWVCNCLF